MSLAQEVRELSDNNRQLTNEYIRAKKESEKAKKQAEQLAKKLELARQEKENKKEYERDLKKAVENDLITTFSRCFENEGLENGYINLRLKKTRDDILNNVPENDFEWHFVNNNYERILEKVKKIYKNDFEAKQILTQEETAKQLLKEMEQKQKEAEEQQRKQERQNIIKGFCNLLGFILNPITLLIIFLIWGYFYFAVPILNN